MSLLSNRVGNTAGPKPRRGLSLLQGRKRQAGLTGIFSELVHLLACLALWHQEVIKHHFFQSKDRSPCRSLFQVSVSPQTRTTGRGKRQVPTAFKSNKRSAVLYPAWDASSGQTLKCDKQRKRGTKRWHMALDHYSQWGCCPALRHHPLLPARGGALYLPSKWSFRTDHKWSREGGKSKHRLVCHT